MTILLVEDDFLVAWDAMDALQREGAHVEGPTSSLDGARQLIRKRPPDAAMLDINLGDGIDFELADLLAEMKVPFLFCTGYNRKAVPDRFARVPIIEKPYEIAKLVMALKALRQRQ